ncbi:hypothetical protein Ahy_B09g095869 isoform D [Arachis hypogaea]|uniref:Aminoacyl-tRNA synthetase class Ia domain-containing protein n=1 Tax=Arachis hypogaea TaxID=3818 RepID=A0A444XGV9_ARAHY|nr:hypothetical protein Ahy_B09g095869 isoform D [Arachis hypogaea]
MTKGVLLPRATSPFSSSTITHWRTTKPSVPFMHNRCIIATQPPVPCFLHDFSKVLSRTTCSSSRRTNSNSLSHPSRVSLAKAVSINTNISNYCTHSAEEFCSSKRRSRGPVMAAKKAAEGVAQEDGKYKHTVDLPKTTFGMRANSSQREPELQKIWDENQVLKNIADKNTGGNFILHDGPPYANGDLHIGHALNKILKDIINRYKVSFLFLAIFFVTFYIKCILNPPDTCL